MSTFFHCMDSQVYNKVINYTLMHDRDSKLEVMKLRYESFVEMLIYI